MVLFKSCPRCGTGDLLKTEDMFGAYFECVQCGFVKDLADPRAPVKSGDAEVEPESNDGADLPLRLA